jgi:hypothetical protein
MRTKTSPHKTIQWMPPIVIMDNVAMVSLPWAPTYMLRQIKPFIINGALVFDITFFLYYGLEIREVEAIM